MTVQHLSKRLRAVAELVPPSRQLADIGSDHAYLPAYLLQRHVIQAAIAGEVRLGPLQNAQKEITKLGLATVMQARLGDGLAVLNPTDQVDVIVMAGMGGELISDILTAGQAKLANHPVLVLQPNVDENTVRRWLVAHQYQISAECIVEDSGHFYEMMRAEFSPTPVRLSETEINFGPQLLAQKDAIFQKKWRDRLQKSQLILSNLENSASQPQDKIAAMQRRVTAIQEVLHDNG
ncbi:tRNA (adenine(22)-N(1))-methyltransferase TrmK [Fructilactobacillus hinvesii]|uniref:tRNA (Adenine(22)-N(1))-methyltransferase TrmK n=1 Tax=Fructilactobacillus hinvesii TaxID=2940300 RepID=A0ABY5BRW8_9LACO|nr:tRNA (adenine(22)-N(1))-methyltransferase TrmK [Fructilactobacillus hinvesii]USS87395.1 tRNA (adenine(22)-N(1))-methyltransferase TrmK [Fructilactobacillus hinvesii]